MHAREYAYEAENDYDARHEHVDEHDEQILEAADARRKHTAQRRLAVHGHVAFDQRRYAHQSGYEPSQHERGEHVRLGTHVEVANLQIAHDDQVAVNADERMMPQETARRDDARVDKKLADDVRAVPLHERVGEANEELIEADVEDVVELTRDNEYVQQVVAELSFGQNGHDDQRIAEYTKNYE